MATREETKQFIRDFDAVAMLEHWKHGIPASITLAQAIIESAWGESKLSTKYKNYFGIKSHGVAGGTIMQTAEHSPTKGYYSVADSFRVYATPIDSFKDHSAFLMNNPRYKGLWEEKDYVGWANGLQKAGYATSPTYAEKLIAIIEQHKLYRFDVVGQKKKVATTSVGGISIDINIHGLGEEHIKINKINKT